MTGAAIARWGCGRGVVLAVHGAFDGASAWALRVEMDESTEREFVIDLTHAVEAYEFAAGIIASWARRRPEKRVRFRAGSEAHVRLLAGYALEILEEDTEALPFWLASSVPRSPAPSGAAA